MADIVLRAVPLEIRKIVLKEQSKEKENRGTSQYSMSSTIFKIIREWETCYNSQKDKK